MDDCILTTNRTDHFGYGRVFKVRFGKRIALAHVAAWIDAHGCLPPEDKPCILHRCDNPSCINVAHLFTGTKGDNNRDKAAKGRHHNQVKTHCRNGHPYDDANTIHKGTERICRQCHNANARAYRARKKLTCRPSQPI